MKDRWIDIVKSQSLDVVAPELGLTGYRMRSWGPCPSCSEEKRGADDRRGAIGSSKDKRGWRCHRCGAHGDVLDLISWVQFGQGVSAQTTSAAWGELREWCSARGWCTAPGDRAQVRSVGSRIDELLDEGRRRDSGDRSAIVPEEEPSKERSGNDGGAFAWRDGLAEECTKQLWSSTTTAGQVLDYLRGRGFNDETIREWGLGYAIMVGEPWLTIPLRDASERVVNVRFRRLPGEDGTTARPKYRVCSGRPLPLFGADRLGNDLGSSVLVCEGELDVIAMWQYGYQVSVVTGTAGAGAWKEEWLDALEPYESFVLLYDNDDAGEEGAKKFAAKMGIDRCARAVLPRKDAGQCLQDKVHVDSITRVVDLAQPMFGVGFRRVHEYEADLERLISHPEELIGRTTGSGLLDRALGGLRPGLVVVSGDTGHGKSTFCDWLCYQQAVRGVPVAISSLENRPIAAIQKLLRMRLGGDFTRVTAEERAEALRGLGNLPLHILDHYGHMSPETLMNTIRYSARRLGVKVVLIDPLQFIVPPDADDERRAIEAIIRALAVTAYTYGITIILICHPKGLQNNAPRVTMNDIKGASGIKQDADVVLIVVRDPPRPKAKPPRDWPAAVIHVDKVRADFGSPGSSVTLAFGALSCCYADAWELTPEGSGGQLIAYP
jgi:twinkle protein